ncbi:hypothetical protein ACFL27_16310 [candidate division CSSED10-310 bacterium]|uniref:Uncharacterized protein n=1 Tax=candidate division CSSED10-310 bacterium TaxID=2855610 RepID=A0ABV6YZY2_UNCC1
MDCFDIFKQWYNPNLWQVSQLAGNSLYREACYRVVRWLAQRNLTDKIRIKLGCGEPMQRQGGYYDPTSGKPVVITSKNAAERLATHVKPSTRRSTHYARSPLQGILAGGDFRTYQSNVMEHLRYLSAAERVSIFHHVRQAQQYFENELIRAAEPLADTRLSFQEKGLQELEMLSRGARDPVLDQFITLVTKYFSQILYGQEQDVVGIHVISYFISRSIPPLRDRPVVRPSRETSKKSGPQIVERLAQILPLSQHGSLLRAIGHNRAQTMILGINQLTTGLFRALNEFLTGQSISSDRQTLIIDRILPRLPVKDILHTVRIFHDPFLTFLKQLEMTYPAGNSAFLALREDNDSVHTFLSLLQKEFLRRQGLDVSEFFSGEVINGSLLPTLRPDIAVLVQPDLFNIDLELILAQAGGHVESEWQEQVATLLQLPAQIKYWREKVWHIIYEPIRTQVESFVKLALAIDRLSTGHRKIDAPFGSEPAQVTKLGAKIADLLRGVVDDSMRQFLTSAVQYLTQAPKEMDKVPIEVIRALRDVERIVRIEKQALGEKEQNLVRFYVLQMARLCGENG